MKGLGHHFGRSGAPFWSDFGGLGGFWSGSQIRLGRRFGRFMGDFQSQDGSNLGPKKVPSWSQNGVKIDEKIDQKIDGFGNRFLKGFWWLLGRILAPKSRPKSILSSKGVFLKKHCFSSGKTVFFPKNSLSKIISISASILVPKSFPKSTKIPSKIDFQSHRIFNRFSHQFLHRFGSNLGPSWAPSWSHLGSENRPRAAQDAFQDAFGSQNPPRPPK